MNKNLPKTDHIFFSVIVQSFENICWLDEPLILLFCAALIAFVKYFVEADCCCCLKKVVQQFV